MWQPNRNQVDDSGADFFTTLEPFSDASLGKNEKCMSKTSKSEIVDKNTKRPVEVPTSQSGWSGQGWKRLCSSINFLWKSNDFECQGESGAAGHGKFFNFQLKSLRKVTIWSGGADRLNILKRSDEIKR